MGNAVKYGLLNDPGYSNSHHGHDPYERPRGRRAENGWELLSCAACQPSCQAAADEADSQPSLRLAQQRNQWFGEIGIAG